ncbi:MBL fold metallo-hydrolase [Synechococcales cyanobacterium C]|uniref:MBL fold metallo-hydrolase n=1 Tax=Petrachloros mirabilis ULC683 TaxID=2781853 RepID=A0A8K1ZWX8_9CYAN|nr:MBL fold metallo-hydrolase [Petrachloros mirabilis]NCJ05626.1 MBL fold metallo-hydrolase [Petrachloros mirabilis ULC683]
MQETLIVRFWGVRGSIPSPGFSTLRYGGNTPCVEVHAGATRLIFDGGTGLRVLGQALLKQMPLEAHLFFGHTHWDHIQGFPFFTPAFIEGNRFHIYGTLGPQGQTIEQRLTDQMLHPNFPVPLQVMGGELKFYDLEVGQTLVLGAVTVRNGPLNHPGGAVGYRVEWQGRVVSYITDTEHPPDGLDLNVLALAQGADVLIYDATYTDAEYQDSYHSKVGWGHSTWQVAIQVAQAAAAERLVLFHHDPLHDDGFLDQVAAAAQAKFASTMVAHEGLTLCLLPRACLGT